MERVLRCEELRLGRHRKGLFFLLRSEVAQQWLRVVRLLFEKRLLGFESFVEKIVWRNSVVFGQKWIGIEVGEN